MPYYFVKKIDEYYINLQLSDTIMHCCMKQFVWNSARDTLNTVLKGTAMIETDNESSFPVFRQATIARNACKEIQHYRYYEHGVPCIYINECCETLWEFINLNTNGGQLHQHGDWRTWLMKVYFNDLIQIRSRWSMYQLQVQEMTNYLNNFK